MRWPIHFFGCLIINRFEQMTMVIIADFKLIRHILVFLHKIIFYSGIFYISTLYVCCQKRSPLHAGDALLLCKYSQIADVTSPSMPVFSSRTEYTLIYALILGSFMFCISTTRRRCHIWPVEKLNQCAVEVEIVSLTFMAFFDEWEQRHCDISVLNLYWLSISGCYA